MARTMTTDPAETGRRHTPDGSPDPRVDEVSGSEFGFEDVGFVPDPAMPRGGRGTDRAAPLPVGAPLLDWLARQRQLEPASEVVGTAAETVTAGGRGPILRGEWLGHPLHPALTDLPIGCWTSATVLDLLAGRRARPAATLLVGAGVLAAVPTIAAGLADFTGLDDERSRRLATAHAAGNAVATAMYALSWRARHRRHHLRGVGWGLAGGAVATLAGFVGGHLAFGQDAAGEE
jgi:uncharacterized membrane protein